MFIALVSLLSAHAATWNLDPAHSRVGFSVSHMTISTVEGSFSGVEATLDYEVGRLSELKTTVTVDMATVDTRNADRDAHLKKEDFLFVEEHPEMTFVSTAVKPGKKGTFELVGDLTLRGVTKRVTFEGTGLQQVALDPWGNERLGAKATAVIDRQAFGVSYNQTLDRGGLLVGDEVTIELAVEFVKAK